MLGLIELSGVGIIVGGGLIALIIYSIPQLRVIASHPILAFVIGIIIAYLLDDYSTQITQGDILAITLMVVTLIIMLIPIIKDWAKARKADNQKLQEKIESMDIRLSKIEGNVETILGLYPRKK